MSLMDFESDDETPGPADKSVNKGLNALSRRRSSIGSRSKPNPAEQSRIADMYKTVIKLAAENVSTCYHSNEFCCSLLWSVHRKLQPKTHGI